MPCTRFCILAAVLSVGVACSSGSTETVASADGSLARVEAARSAGGDAADADACLLDYQTRYDDLLTRDVAAQAAGLPADEAEVEYQKVMKQPQYHEVRYAWPSDRTRTIEIAGRRMTTPRDNVVALGGMRAMDLDYFRNAYRPVTEDASRALDEAIDASTEKALEPARNKAVARGLAGVIADVTQAYREVDGLGEAASFNTIESKLYVVDRGVSFAVTADTSDDADANERVAIAVAERALAACQ